MKKKNRFRKSSTIGCMILCLMAVLTVPTISKSRKQIMVDPSSGIKIPVPYVSGSILIKGGMPGKRDLKVSINKFPWVYPQRRIVLSSGDVRFFYKIRVEEAKRGKFIVSASIVNSLYKGGTWQPPLHRLSQVPAKSVDFCYQTPAGNVHWISAQSLASFIDLVANSLKMRLHNNKGGSSYIQSGNHKYNFSFPRTTIDLDCGPLCPDLGDGHFYVNDVNLRDTQFDWTGSKFKFKAFFEDKDREIKGYHNRLGDRGMPNFQLNNINMYASAGLDLTADGKLTFYIYGLKLDVDAHSTGGCHLFGIDICNALLGTNSKIKRGIVKAARTALNHQKIKDVMGDLIMFHLRPEGIYGKIIRVRIVGNQVEITTRSTFPSEVTAMKVHE